MAGFRKSDCADPGPKAGPNPDHSPVEIRFKVPWHTQHANKGSSRQGVVTAGCKFGCQNLYIFSAAPGFTFITQPGRGKLRSTQYGNKNQPTGRRTHTDRQKTLPAPPSPSVRTFSCPRPLFFMERQTENDNGKRHDQGGKRQRQTTRETAGGRVSHTTTRRRPQNAAGGQTMANRRSCIFCNHT